jgi:hypothetical protein
MRSLRDQVKQNEREINFNCGRLRQCKWTVPMELFKRFLRDETGAATIEYGLIAAGISVAIIKRWILSTSGSHTSLA